jgi:hypothetical protein
LFEHPDNLNQAISNNGFVHDDPAVAAEPVEREPNQELVEQFVNAARIQGYLVYEELRAAIDQENDLATMEAIEARLTELGIPITREAQSSELVEVTDDFSGVDATLYDPRITDIDLPVSTLMIPCACICARSGACRCSRPSRKSNWRRRWSAATTWSRRCV